MERIRLVREDIIKELRKLGVAPPQDKQGDRPLNIGARAE
jgi:hypothetical protein